VTTLNLRNPNFATWGDPTAGDVIVAFSDESTTVAVRIERDGAKELARFIRAVLAALPAPVHPAFLRPPVGPGTGATP
jgi:hypothetical protein